jgi:predicted transposase YdaD
MGVLHESPWYQEILRDGEVQGIVLSIRTSLEAKFGNEGLELMPQISQFSDLQRLQAILRSVVLANTVEEILQVL